jgi:hypothetical protein
MKLYRHQQSQLKTPSDFVKSRSVLGAVSGRTVIRVNLKGDEEKPSLVVKIEKKLLKTGPKKCAGTKK